MTSAGELDAPLQVTRVGDGGAVTPGGTTATHCFHVGGLGMAGLLVAASEVPAQYGSTVIPDCLITQKTGLMGIERTGNSSIVRAARGVSAAKPSLSAVSVWAR